jgi:SET domain-containing protein
MIEVEPIFYVNPKIMIHNSNVHGYGVFAREEIKEGETIEVCRLLRLAWRMAYQSDPVIRDYVWGTVNCPCEQCKLHGPNAFIALGFGSIYNHKDEPNTTIKLDYEKGSMTVVAKTNIGRNEEIFVTYGQKYWMTRSNKEENDTKNDQSTNQ